MRFIGHLDVMRYFQKAFRRAHIPVSYSKGYSPHQILSFTSPLGIGLTSDAEYMDMELEECPEPERMVDWINSQMNDEIRVKDFVLLPDDSKPSMAMLAGCDYLVALKPDKVSVFRDRADMELVLADCNHPFTPAHGAGTGMPDCSSGCGTPIEGRPSGRAKENKTYENSYYYCNRGHHRPDRRDVHL